MDINQKLLEFLLYSLDKRNLTEKECLLRSGINTSFFSDWKSGKVKSPSFDKIYRILKTLKIPISDLPFEECQGEGQRLSEHYYKADPCIQQAVNKLLDL